MLKINAICRCYNELKYNTNGQIIGYEYPFDYIQVKKLEKGKFRVPEFCIVIDICIKDSLKEENPIFTNIDEKLDFVIRVTKCDENEDKRYYFPLHSFCITPTDLVNKRISRSTGMDIVNHREIIVVRKLELDCTGQYVLKVLLKDKYGKYTVQSASQIRFFEND